MRTALRLLGTRYGLAVVLVVVVLAIVGVGRFMSDGVPSEQVGPRVPPASAPGDPASSNVEAGDDASGEPDDTNMSPSLSAGTPGISTVAQNFITAWLKHTGVTGDQWRSGLTPYTTSDLMNKLKDTDPGSVPAESVTGSITIRDEGGSVWSAAVPVNGGIVTLRLIAMRGHWQVDGIDWEQS